MSEVYMELRGKASWKSYLELCKPNVVLLIVFTAIVGMMLATEGAVSWVAIIFGVLGIGLGAASGAAVNHVVDQKIDAIMDRTKNRPLPTGGMSSEQALTFALVLALVSMAILISCVNILTAGLTLLSMIGYAVIYTMFLKRATPHNIVLGGAAGAAPPVLGWAAVTGEVSVEALVLFLIIFIWTPPHFWALAIKRRNDYADAGLPMLPVTHGIDFTKQQILLYTFMLLAVSLLPFIIHMSGLFYLASALILGLVFIYHAVKLCRAEGDQHAMATFGFSIVYLMVLFMALLLDHFLVIFLGLAH